MARRLRRRAKKIIKRSQKRLAAAKKDENVALKVHRMIENEVMPGRRKPYIMIATDAMSEASKAEKKFETAQKKASRRVRLADLIDPNKKRVIRL